VRAHVRAHERCGDRTVVIGPMRDPPDHQMSPWVRWEQAMLAKQYDAMEAGHYDATARQFFTGNASLRREHILAAGGFDPALRRAEDVELAYRLDTAGLTFVYEPNAVGLHYAERSFRSWLAAGYAYGRNDIVFARDRGKPEIFSWVADEYRTRHPLTRWMTRTCATRPRLAAASTAVLSRVAVGCSVARLPRAASKALSGAYHLAYYGGVADELGGPDELARLLDGGAHEVPI
jgi:GT2 family glycosyltransferase